MDQKKTCEICNRLYKTKLSGDYIIPGTSSAYIRFAQPNKSTVFKGDICPNCARELIWKVKTMKRNAPKKCDFCEFDRGPLYETPQPECKHCIKYSNFQLKKRMREIEKVRWAHFNGDLNNSPTAINEMTIL